MSSLTSLQQTNLPLSEFPILPEQIHYVEKDGEIYFAAKDIARGLGYTEPRKVHDLYNRYKDELEEFSTVLKLGRVDDIEKFVSCFLFQKHSSKC
jgi:prophage antirepressor-like protein